jgi:hypothetical protein
VQVGFSVTRYFVTALVRLKALCGLGDEGEPCIIVMTPAEG